jgi:phosphoglycolate phosphatase-like HAD superfamily hydrolase
MIDFIKQAKLIFWDFDGVIKESVEVKTEAFVQLFSEFGDEVAKKVKLHHEENGGMSRFEKLPIYLKWAGKVPTEKTINEYSKQFSSLVKQKVIESEWVPGVKSYLINNSKKQQFFLVTATPQQEIEDIVSTLKIKSCFNKIIGYPTSKKDAIQILISNTPYPLEEAIMIGDSISDYNAAVESNIVFILRKTGLNEKLQKELECQKILDLNE